MHCQLRRPRFGFIGRSELAWAQQQQKVSDSFFNHALRSEADLRIPSQLSISAVIHRLVTVVFLVLVSFETYYHTSTLRLGETDYQVSRTFCHFVHKPMLVPPSFAMVSSKLH